MVIGTGQILLSNGSDRLVSSHRWKNGKVLQETEEINSSSQNRSQPQ